MGTLLIINGILARMQVRRIVISPLRHSPIFAREPTRIGIRARNISPLPSTITICVIDQTWFLERLESGREVECSALRDFPKRGRYPISDIVVWSGYPFDFIRYVSEIARHELTTESLVVLPEPGEVDAEGLRRWILQEVVGNGQARKILRRITSDQADIRGVRPYRSGDCLRTVHWRTSARSRSLFVREYDSAPSPDLLVIVDPWLEAEPTDDDLHFFEAALSLTATILRAWVRAFGSRTTLAIAGCEFQLNRIASPNDESVRYLMIPLADVCGSQTCVIPCTVSFLQTAQHSARVLVSTTSTTRLPESLATVVDRSFVVLNPRKHYLWYQPPRSLLTDSFEFHTQK
jgi:uncharacterized protein (DUF58 family)